MSQDENGIPLSERLPQRKPDQGLWQVIEDKLNKPTIPLSEKLPVHQPDVDLWEKISGSLPAASKLRKQRLIKSSVTVLLLLLVFFSWMYFPVNQSGVDNFSDKVEDTGVAAEPEISGSTSQNLNDLTGEETPSIDSTASQHITTENIIAPTKTIPLIFTTDQKHVDQHFAEDHHLNIAFEDQSAVGQMSSSANPGFEVSKFNALNAISPNKYLNSDPRKMSPSARSSFSGYSSTNNLIWEIGGYLQASWIQNISSINNNWYFKPEAGISFGVRKKHFLFETGVSYCRFSFEDRIEFEYFKAVFLGTLITADNWVLEEYIDDDGMPQTRKNYIVELVDIYDTTFVEQVKDDRVMLSIVTVPLTFGYRLKDNGKMFYDLKTGIDLMIMNGDVLPGNWQTPTMAERLEFHHSFVGNYSLKWKYHLAMGIGCRMNEHMSVYAAPSVWWSPDKIQQKESDTFKNPFEAGLRMGVKWEL